MLPERFHWIRIEQHRHLAIGLFHFLNQPGHPTAAALDGRNAKCRESIEQAVAHECSAQVLNGCGRHAQIFGIKIEGAKFLI